MIGASTKLFAQFGPVSASLWYPLHCLQNRYKKSQNQNGHLRSYRAQGSSPSIQLTSGSGSRWCRLCIPGLAPMNQEEPNHHFLVGAFDTIFGILLVLDLPSVNPRDRNQCTPQWRGWTCPGTEERGIDVLLYCAPIFSYHFLNSVQCSWQPQEVCVPLVRVKIKS